MFDERGTSSDKRRKERRKVPPLNRKKMTAEDALVVFESRLRGALTDCSVDDSTGDRFDGLDQAIRLCQDFIEEIRAKVD